MFHCKFSIVFSGCLGAYLYYSLWPGDTTRGILNHVRSGVAFVGVVLAHWKNKG